MYDRVETASPEDAEAGRGPRQLQDSESERASEREREREVVPSVYTTIPRTLYPLSEDTIHIPLPPQYHPTILLEQDTTPTPSSLLIEMQLSKYKHIGLLGDTLT